MNTKEPQLKNRLKELRTSRELTQEQLANLTGVHQVNICKIETGTRPLSGKSLLKLSRFFDINPMVLLGEKNIE